MYKESRKKGIKMSKYKVMLVGMGKRGKHHAAAFNENEKLSYTLWDSVNFSSEKQKKIQGGISERITASG